MQQPTQRGRGSDASGHRGREAWRKVLAWMPLAAKVLLAVCLGVALFLCYRAARSSSFFQVQSVNVAGAERVSLEEVERVVRRTVAPAGGVWKADLDTISHELKRHLPVRTAIVSRVLPATLRVRFTERAPRAVVRTAAGRLVWVDEDAVTLGQLVPTDRMPAFFIRGWDESQTDAAQAENRERVGKYLEIERVWNELGIAERVSEINLDDLRNLRVQLAGSDAQIEVRLGREEFGERLKRALEVLDEQRRTSRGTFITRLDASLNRRVIVGFSSGSQTFDGDASPAEKIATEIVGPAEKNRLLPRRDAETPSSSRAKSRGEASSTKGVGRTDGEQRSKIERQGKNERVEEAKSLAVKTRPRRVEGNNR